MVHWCYIFWNGAFLDDFIIECLGAMVLYHFGKKQCNVNFHDAIGKFMGQTMAKVWYSHSIGEKLSFYKDIYMWM